MLSYIYIYNKNCINFCIKILKDFIAKIENKYFIHIFKCYYRDFNISGNPDIQEFL